MSLLRVLYERRWYSNGQQLTFTSMFFEVKGKDTREKKSSKWRNLRLRNKIFRRKFISSTPTTDQHRSTSTARAIIWSCAVFDAVENFVIREWKRLYYNILSWLTAAVVSVIKTLARLWPQPCLGEVAMFVFTYIYMYVCGPNLYWWNLIVIHIKLKRKNTNIHSFWKYKQKK